MLWGKFTPFFVGRNLSQGNSLHSLQKATPFSFTQSQVGHELFFPNLQFPFSSLHPLQGVFSGGIFRKSETCFFSFSVMFSSYIEQRKQANPQGAVNRFLSIIISEYLNSNILKNITTVKEKNFPWISTQVHFLQEDEI